MPSVPDFSFVVPAYNEAARMPDTVPRMLAWLEGAQVGRFEIVVVDDGSTDGTAARARELLRGRPGRVVSYRPNRGKGGAVRSGMLAARGRVRLFSDMDLSTPIEEVPKFLRAHAAGHDVVIGSRKRPGACVELHQPILRESMGKFFTFLSNVLVVSGISDFTCGFKSFTGAAADRVFPHLTLMDWSYDAELLWLVRRHGLRLREVPVRWRDDPGTKVKPLRDTVRSLIGLARLVGRRVAP